MQLFPPEIYFAGYILLNLDIQRSESFQRPQNCERKKVRLGNKGKLASGKISNTFWGVSYLYVHR